MAAAVDLSTSDASAPGLRLLAETRYITTDYSIVQLVQQEPFKSSGVHRTTVEAWCCKYEWVKQREAFQETWKAKALDKLGDMLLQQRWEQLKVLERVQAKLIAEIEESLAGPQPFLGMVNALVKVAGVIGNLCDRLMPAAIPESVREEPPRHRPNLSADEARAVTRTILESRRQAAAKSDAG